MSKWVSEGFKAADTKAKNAIPFCRPTVRLLWRRCPWSKVWIWLMSGPCSPHHAAASPCRQSTRWSAWSDSDQIVCEGVSEWVINSNKSDARLQARLIVMHNNNSYSNTPNLLCGVDSGRYGVGPRGVDINEDDVIFMLSARRYCMLKECQCDTRTYIHTNLGVR